MTVWESAGPASQRDELVIVGHRGVRGGPEAENTAAAFERALREGARAVELDVRICATGELVVFHDPDLARATENKDRRRIREVPYLELGSMGLFGTRQGVPLLRDILVLAANRRAGVNVEMKHDDVDPFRLVRLVARELDRGPFDVIVSSFDPRLLVRLKARRPKTRIALLTTSERRWSLPLGLATAGSLFAVHLERVQVTPRVLRALRGRCRVGVWTVNDPREGRELRASGVNWVITDCPRLLVG
jgi:glycerophosphoryl diester phosphodiesterase